jgi:trigger factor
MQTSIKQVTPVEYDLEINAGPDDLAEDFQAELRNQRTRTNLKGFRRGKVPTSLVKKLYGKAIAYGLAERSIQQTYESEVMQPGEHKVLGQPKITTLEYEMDGDLHAVIRFGVRPEFEVVYPKRASVSKLLHEVADDEVDHDIESLRDSEADLVPVDDKVGDDDFVLVDLQKLDPETGTPLIGQKREDVTFYLGDQRLREEFRKPLLGAAPGGTVRITIPDDEGGDPVAYELTVKEIKRKDLPELDDEFVKTATKGQAETVDQLREQVTKRLQNSWDQQSKELLETKVVETIVEANQIDVPESVIEMYLDSFVEEVRKNSGDSLPEGFDEDAFRESRKDEAIYQARWMLIKDKIVGDEDLAVADEDREKFFEKSASGGEISTDLLRQYYESINGLIEQLDQRLMTEKVIDFLLSKFKVVEKDRKAFEKEIEKAAKKNKKK